MYTGGEREDRRCRTDGGFLEFDPMIRRSVHAISLVFDKDLLCYQHHACTYVDLQ